MNLTAVLIDSRPPALGEKDGRGPSLLLAPLGSGTLLDHHLLWLEDLTSQTVRVLPAFAPDRAYEEAVHRTSVAAVFTLADLRSHLGDLEPSDWVLLVDPRLFALTPPGAAAVLGAMADLRWVTHWVALERGPEETEECVELDEFGHVSRIERYYADVTWPCRWGTAFSLLPVAALRLIDDPSSPFGAGADGPSLAALRASLASHGVPSRDLALAGATIDLADEGGLARLIERSVRDLTAGARSRWVGRGCRIDPTARVLGPLVIQDGATIGAGATVVGPALIGAGCRIEPEAVVAQCAIAGRAVVERGTTVRHQVLGDAESATDYAEDGIDVLSGPSARSGRDATEDPAGWKTPSPALILKRAIDVVLAAAGLALLAPFLLAVALAVKLESAGPVLFGSVREGKGRKAFRVWKFRTMVDGADALQRRLYRKNGLDGPQFKLDSDPRVTRIGRWLRAANVDELPQLWNVLVGEMSLVGPRPSPFRENQICVPWRQARLSVRPGITGLWQVCRHERSSGDFHQWIEYDMLYVREMSPGLDLRILFATIATAGGKWSVPVSWIVPGSRPVL